MTNTVHGFADGDRVRHRRWDTTGTVRTVKPDRPTDPLIAEVRWDGSFVADELDLVVADLDPLGDPPASRMNVRRHRTLGRPERNTRT